MSPVTATTVYVEDDLQASVDATPEGGTLRLGVGTYRVPSGGLILSRNIVIEGMGTTARDDPQTGTVLAPYADDTAGQPIIVIEPPHGTAQLAYDGMSVHLKGLSFSGNCTAARAGSYGVVMDYGAVELSLLREFKMTDCSFLLLGDTAIYLHSKDGALSCIVGAYFENVRCIQNFGHGHDIDYATVVQFHNCAFDSNRKFGGIVSHSGVRYQNCVFESNGRTSVGGEASDAQLQAVSCNVLRVEGCHFENFDGATRSGVAYIACKGIYTYQCLGVSIVGNLFVNGSFDGQATPIRVYEHNQAITIANGPYGTPAHIAANYFAGCYYGINVQTESAGVGYYNADVFNQAFAWSYDCTIPYYNCSGFGLPKHDPTYVPASLESTDPYQRKVEGLVYWDTGREAPRVYSAATWKSLAVAEDVLFWEGEVLSYDDELLTAL